MKRILGNLLTIAFFLGLGLAVHSQGSGWQALNGKLMSLYRQGAYDEAQIVGTQALQLAERSFGPDHLKVAKSLNNLALVYAGEREYAQAEQLLERSLAIREKALGPDHLLVAKSLHNLALVYFAQSQYALAEPLFKRSLAIRERAHGPHFSSVARSLNKLGLLYTAQGQYAEAKQLLERSLAIREKALGPGHLDVATSLSNLALLYYKQGQYAKAEPLLKRCFLIQEKVLGPNHPDVAASRNRLAEIYNSQGRFTDIVDLFEHQSFSATPPSVSIFSPLPLESVTGIFKIEASTFDELGIAQAEFLIDGQPIHAGFEAIPLEKVDLDQLVIDFPALRTSKLEKGLALTGYLYNYYAYWYSFRWADGAHSLTASVSNKANLTAQDSLYALSQNNAHVNPQILSITIAKNPFRLVVVGSNFMPGANVLINRTVVPGPKIKSSSKIVLTGAATLKALTPSGIAVPVVVVNPDGGGSSRYNYIRP